MDSPAKILDKITARAESGMLRRPFLVATTLTKDMLNRDVFKQASAMAYVTLLSLIPSLVAIFCVLSLFSPLMSGGNLVEMIRDFILKNLASGTGESVVTYLDRMLTGLDLATIGWSSFGSVLITLVLLLRQIEEALNKIWLINQSRNVFTRFMYFWTFMTLGIIVLAVVAGVSSVNIKKYLDATAAHAESNVFTNMLFAYGGSFIFFFFLYKVVPNCKVQSRNAAAGAATAGVILAVAGWGYGVFVSNAGNYQTLYGALAQLPLFLMWLYICWIIILLGAMLSWRMQEGFPSSSHATGTSTLEGSTNPIDIWRNTQLKNLLPKIALLAIYKNFQSGSGKGISTQDLGHTLNMPIDWVRTAMETLASLGFVVRSAASSNDILGLDGGNTDTYFPAFPPEKLDMKRIDHDLQISRDTWIEAWLPDLPKDLQGMLGRVTKSSVAQSSITVADLIAE